MENSTYNKIVADVWHMKQVAERVEAGAEFLDKKKPGWHQLVNIGQLDLASGHSCICGQVFIEEVMHANRIYEKWLDDNYDPIDEFWADEAPINYDDGYDYALVHIVNGETSSQTLGFNCLTNETSPVLKERIADFNAYYHENAQVVTLDAIEYELLATEWILQIEKRNAMDHDEEG